MKILRNITLAILATITCSAVSLSAMKRTLEDPEKTDRPLKRVKIEEAEFALICSDGTVPEVPMSLLKHSITLLNMAEDEQAAIKKELPVVNIDTGTMQIIISCLKLINDHACTSSKNKISQSLYTQIEQDCFNGFDKNNFSVYQETIVKLLGAAYYLDIPLLIPAIKSVISNNLTSLFPLASDGKRTITTEFFVDIEEHLYKIFEAAGKPEADFEQQVAQKGRSAIPGNVVIENIMPHIIVDLLATKHGVGIELIQLMLKNNTNIIDMQKMKESWDLFKKMLGNENEQECDKGIITLLSLFDDKIITRLSSFNTNGPDEETLKVSLINKCKNIKNEIRQLWTELEQGTKAQIFQRIQKTIEQLEQIWEKLDAGFKNKYMDFFKSLINKSHLSSINACAIEILLSKPNKDIYTTFEKATEELVILEASRLGLEESFVAFIVDNPTIAFTLQNILHSLLTDILTLIDDNTLIKCTQIFHTTQSLCVELNSSTGMMLKINSLLNPFLADNIPSVSLQKIQDPSLQILFLANTNNTDLMEWLNSYGNDYINTTEPITNLCPLYAACNAGNLEASQFIINRGLDLINNVVNANGDTPLHAACQSCSLELVQFLLENGGNPNALNQKQCSPLISLFIGIKKYANDKNVDEIYRIVQLLIKYGAEVNLSDDQNVTALHYACYTASIVPSSIQIVSFLLEQGASVDAQDSASDTSLLYACRLGSLELVKLLISKNANINATNKNKVTALIAACCFNRPTIAEELLTHNANVSIITIDGLKAFDCVGLCVKEPKAGSVEHVIWQNSINFIKSLLIKHDPSYVSYATYVNSVAFA